MEVEDDGTKRGLPRFERVSDFASLGFWQVLSWVAYFVRGSFIAVGSSHMRSRKWFGMRNGTLPETEQVPLLQNDSH